MLTIKKQLLFLCVLALGVSLKAQTTLNEAADFNVVDIKGNSIHLFEILDHGQAVLIAFISGECGGCQQMTPAMAEAYSYFGCNLHGVFFMEISYIDNNSILEQRQIDFGVEYPMIGIDGGGASVFGAYNIKVCPTLILIKPDRSIPIRFMYPFTVEDYTSHLSSCNIQQHDCTCEAPLSLTADFVGETVALKWTSSPGSESYKVYRDGQVIANVLDACFVDADIQESLEYCYAVSKICHGGLESETGEEVCVVIPTVENCDAPQNLSASFLGEYISLRWDESDRAVSYNVYRNGEYYGNVTETFFLDLDIEEFDEYCYEVSALCQSLSQSDLSDTVCCTLPNNSIARCWNRGFILYPNPVSDKAVLFVNGNSIVKVITMSGQVVFEKEFEGGRMVLDFSKFENAHYIVQIINDDCVFMQQVVVIK